MENINYIHGTAPSEQDRLRLLNELTNPAFLDFLEIKTTDRVLEVGSGLGLLASEVAAQLPEGQLTGIEISEAQLAQCPNDQSNLSFVQGDATKLPFEANTFDVVYGRYILEHLHHPMQALEEVKRVLKTNGKVFFQENAIAFVKFYPDCPTFDKVWHQFLVLQSQLGGDGMIGIKLHHLLKHTGFSELELSIAPEIHSPENGKLIPWVDNIIGNIHSGAAALLDRQLATQAEIGQAVEELSNLKKRADASAYFYWNRVKGMKS